jgi:hypothetical protein
MAWMDIAVSTVGIFWGGAGGTDAGREILSGGAETDSEASYRPKSELRMEKRSAFRTGRYLPALETVKENGCRRCHSQEDQRRRGRC